MERVDAAVRESWTWIRTPGPKGSPAPIDFKVRVLAARAKLGRCISIAALRIPSWMSALSFRSCAHERAWGSFASAADCVCVSVFVELFEGARVRLILGINDCNARQSDPSP